MGSQAEGRTPPELSGAHLRVAIANPASFEPVWNASAPTCAQGLMSVHLERIADGGSFGISGDGSAVRDYIHMGDAVHAMTGLITHGAEGVYNVGSGVGHLLLDIVRAIKDVTSRTVPLSFHPMRRADVPISYWTSGVWRQGDCTGPVRSWKAFGTMSHNSG